MIQPPGFEAVDTSLFCRLHKTIYGLKQAPHTWFGGLKAVWFQRQKTLPFLARLVRIV